MRSPKKCKAGPRCSICAAIRRHDARHEAVARSIWPGPAVPFGQLCDLRACLAWQSEGVGRG